MVARRDLFQKNFRVKTKIKSEIIKDFTIKPAKRRPNFNSKSYRRAERVMERRLNHGRRSIWERIFPKSSMFWKGTHNGVFGPGGHTSWEFKSGNLALLIAIATLIGFILYVIFT